ncbi:hypothetical protein [[Phormidium] sp. ETS-05]|uniref:hypothetical protein n=1 Tax=[Phormidium] sp. ETS-05 TaxID=222819 RepID=UPI0018EF33DC|nr:hypothetical protein [[Phormidium] sp. ETS-05]
MSTTLVIELTEELQQQLLERARQQNISLEGLVLQSLTNLVTSPISEESDPILPLLGTLTSDINDVGENHDFYVGQAWQQESRYAE